MVEPGFEPRQSDPASQLITLFLGLFCSTYPLSGLSDEPTTEPTMNPLSQLGIIHFKYQCSVSQNP